MNIVVSDFDNTIYNNEYLINVEAIKEFVNKNNTFIIATGRNINSLFKKIDEYKIPCKFYICNDGAIIYDKDKNIIYRENINKDIAIDIYNFLLTDSNNQEVYFDNDGIYTNDSKNVNKIIAIPIDKEKAKLTLNKILKKYPEVDGYVSQKHINIISKKSTKGNAIKYLIDNYNLDKNKIYTIGDGVNDISMMTDYHSFAIKDSCDELRTYSHMVIDSLEKLLKRF